MGYDKNNMRILFQGDSVTDCSRIREEREDLGKGYPHFVSALFLAEHPDMEIEFINRGISGNRVKDLASRWDEDCIALKPDMVSILIGVNDCWRRYDANDPTSAEEFENTYRSILKRVKDELDAKIILCEPFVLPVVKEQWEWREDIDPKIAKVRMLAQEFNALYVPLDGLFARAASYGNRKKWVKDGVHPTPSGHALIAKSWMETIAPVL